VNKLIKKDKSVSESPTLSITLYAAIRIEAVDFYSGQFRTVLSIAAKFRSESAVLVRESQSALSKRKWSVQLPTSDAI
jgi:hypothetical protein